MNLERVLIGKPLRSEDAVHQAISNKVGLAVFASDNLSSVAYATQEILIVLAAAAAATATKAASDSIYGLSIPISAAIVALLVILTISYRQTIFAYPSGGGAYIVARDNFGDLAAQVAGAALLIDYILTVSVSVASGMEQVASLIPVLYPFRVGMCLIAIAFMAYMNLRGVKESGAFFAVPTYFFVVVMMLTLFVGMVRWATGTLGTVQGVELVQTQAENLGLFLILRAFSSGCAAVTGVEAISNGIQAFKEPKSRNASNTMLVMAALLGVMFIGTSFLARQVGAVPSESKTIIFQLGDLILGPFVPILIAATTLILILAANTSFADFPRLAALQAKDGFLPRQLAARGSRLVFSWGVIVLALAAAVLIIGFNASTTALIPLYAIGVFLSFSLSQWGMVLHWWRSRKLKPGEFAPSKHGTLHHAPGWTWKLVINAIGGTVSVVVMLIFAATKFASGAWLTVILIPLLVWVFLRIHHHYQGVARALSTGKRVVHPIARGMQVIVLIDDVHMGTVDMVEFAMSLGHPWRAVHFNVDPTKAEKILAKWSQRMGDCAHELTIVPAPYRNLSTVCANYVSSVQMENPDSLIHVVMGQIIMDSWVAQALHANTSIGIKLKLQSMDGVIVTDVSYPIHREDVENAPENETDDFGATDTHNPHHAGDHKEAVPAKH